MRFVTTSVNLNKRIEPHQVNNGEHLADGGNNGDDNPPVLSRHLLFTVEMNNS